MYADDLSALAAEYFTKRLRDGIAGCLRCRVSGESGKCLLEYVKEVDFMLTWTKALRRLTLPPNDHTLPSTFGRRVGSAPKKYEPDEGPPTIPFLSLKGNKTRHSVHPTS